MLFYLSLYMVDLFAKFTGLYLREGVGDEVTNLLGDV